MQVKGNILQMTRKMLTFFLVAPILDIDDKETELDTGSVQKI